jgi:hypothetical protein
LETITEIKEFDRIILGIDPGTLVMGYGIIGIKKKYQSKKLAEKQQKIEIIAFDQ